MREPLALSVLRHKALAHPVRLRLLSMLRDRELCVCQMTSVVDLATSTSAHLAELRGAGLVGERKQGRWVYYRWDEEPDPRRILEDAVGRVAPDPVVKDDERLLRKVCRVSAEDLCRADLDLARLGIRRVARAEATTRLGRRA